MGYFGGPGGVPPPDLKKMGKPENRKKGATL